MLGTSLDGARVRNHTTKDAARVQSGIHIAQRKALMPTAMSIRLRVLAAATVANTAWGWLAVDITTANKEKRGKEIRPAAKDKGSGQGSPALRAHSRGHVCDVVFRSAAAALQGRADGKEAPQYRPTGGGRVTLGHRRRRPQPERRRIGKL